MYLLAWPSWLDLHLEGIRLQRRRRRKIRLSGSRKDRKKGRLGRVVHSHEVAFEQSGRVTYLLCDMAFKKSEMVTQHGPFEKNVLSFHILSHFTFSLCCFPTPDGRGCLRERERGR